MCKQGQAMRLCWVEKDRKEEGREGLLSQLLAEEMVACPMSSFSGQMTDHIHLPHLGHKTQYLPGHMGTASCYSPSLPNPPH